MGTFLTVKGMAEVMLEKAGINSDTEERLAQIGYFSAPASIHFHLAERGGLVRHSINVTQRLVTLTEALGVKWTRPQSPYLVGMLHDLVKCRCYRDTEIDRDKTPKFVYVQHEYSGHGVCSVVIATELGIQLCSSEIASIMYHMGAFNIEREYKEDEFCAAMRTFAPQIIATHTADWYASQVDEESGVTK